jgi:hypothetical protein
MVAELQKLWDKLGPHNPDRMEQELEQLADFYHRCGFYERAIEALELLYRLKQRAGTIERPPERTRSGAATD